MRRNYNRAYLHFIWATWDRAPLLTPQVRAIVYPAIQAKCQEWKCRVEAIGGTENHVHLVIHLGPSISLSNLMKEVKGGSSHLVTLTLPDLFFKWQGAYGVVSVEAKGLPVLRRYVQNQEEHHRINRLEEIWETIDTDDEA